MDGYWGQLEETAEVLRDGWLSTGDIGEWVGDELRITDRKKDLIITAAGRNVAPAPIERALQDIPLVEHAIVHGDARDHLAALVTLDVAEAKRWADGNGRAGLRPEESVRTPASTRPWTRRSKSSTCSSRPATRSSCVRDPPDALKLEAGELTETGKQRRLFVARKYRSLLDALFTT